MVAISLVTAGARALWRQAGVAFDAIRRPATARRCFIYTEVVLRRGGLLRFEHARGLTVVVGEGRLWLTQDHRAHDAQLAAGAQAVLDGEGLALGSTDRDTRVTLCGEVSERMPWRITQVLRCGLRREVAARDSAADPLEPSLPARGRFAGC